MSVTDFTWTELDSKAVAMTRALAADAVQKVGNGHPGTAMSLAPAAYLLFQRHLRHNPHNPNWAGRDRFVLSIGHSSLTLYLQLFLSGYPLNLDDIKSFRTANSQTPGHPEFGHTPGVETTTGPLGQGVANAVGLAMAAKHVNAHTDSTSVGNLLSPTIYVLAGDGCLQEGVSTEASSLAGHLKLDNLVLIYDDNNISIDGETNLSFTEDVSARYRSYGWNVIEVNKLANGDVDIEALDAALSAGKNATNAPTLIRMQTTIAWPAPKLKNTAKAHGSALGAAEIAATKELLGIDPTVDFFIDNAALAHARLVADRGAQLEAQWNSDFATWSSQEAEAAARYRAISSDVDMAAVTAALPTWEVGAKVATRKAGGSVLNALVPVVAQLWGGSADLSESNGTLIENGGSVSDSNWNGRNIHFGIREHAMGAIMNGLALYGLRSYGGTFLVFSDYMRGAVRLAALMGLPSTFVWTHDSIGLGEDGPTHQPIEHLASLRLMPGLAVVRPADANETAAAWGEILKSAKPAGIVLSRQDLVVHASAEVAATNVAKGGYVISDAANAQATIIATGSEVDLAIQAQAALAGQGVAVKVVSMPCTEWFDEQPKAYRSSVIDESLPVVAVEAGATAGWFKYTGRDGAVIGIDRFGASADPKILFEECGVTVEAVVAAIKDRI